MARERTEFDAVKDNVTSIDDIKVALEAAVHRQLMSDVLWRIAFWRFDSSITSAVAAKICANRRYSRCLVSTIAFFSVGLKGLLTWLQPKSSRSYWYDSPRN
jgi:asparagine synthase (glutamine-hydrolysing)